MFEFVQACLEQRRSFDLYHSALVVCVPAGRFVIEMAPVSDAPAPTRGVVGEGPVGSRYVARFRLFRYELRRWKDGLIPDADEAVASPRRLNVHQGQAQRVLDLVPVVPRPVWGRDELATGEM